MERKSAQNGSRSADERSPDGSDKARRDGARFNKSGKGKASHKGASGSGKFRKDGRKGGPKSPRKDRDGRDGGWSPNVDARRENHEERAMRMDGERGGKAFGKRDDRKRSDRGDARPFKQKDSKSKDGFRKNSFKKDQGDWKAGRPGGKDHKPLRKEGDAKPHSKSRDKNKPKGPAYTPPTRALEEGERIAKIMARSGLCSRRDAEDWIRAGRVKVNGKVLETPAVNIHPNDKVLVDGDPLPVRERTRLWLYHKPRGLVTTTSDPEGRPTVFEKLPEGLPRVITVGRLDINTEGLLLLTNDGGLARVLELPSTGWLRRYRVRAYGKVTQDQLDSLAEGIALDGVLYGSIDAQLEREVGDNVWITVALREGKNREVKKVLGHLGLDVNRLIRVSYGPFQLLDLEEGKVNEIRSRVLQDQLGERLVEEAGADFEAPLLTEMKKEEVEEKKAKNKERKSSGGAKGGFMSAKEGARAFAETKDGKKRHEDRGDRDNRDRGDRRDRDDRPPRESYNRIPYAERKPFDPSAPRRTTFTFREEGADGKKGEGRSARRVGGRPQKADLLDPNARLEGKRKGRKDAKKTGSFTGGKGRPERGEGGFRKIRDEQRSDRGGNHRGDRGGKPGFDKGPRGKRDR